MGNTKLMNARAEQLRVNPDEQRLQNRRNSCAHEEVCSMQVISKRQLQTVLTIWLKSCLEFFASQLGQVG